jgi:hypothetical protein
MSSKLLAIKNYDHNHDIISDYDFFDFFINIEHSNRPNIDVIKNNNNYFFKTNRIIEKGEKLSMNFKIISSNYNNLNQHGGNLNHLIDNVNNLKKSIKKFSLEANEFIIFMQNKNNLKKHKLNEFKNKMNKSEYFKNSIDNKFIYKVAKILKKKSFIQKGGTYNLQDGMTNNIERLPNIEAGSFIHHPQSITMTQKIDKLHLILDLLGIIPGYGIAADTINFLLYFIRGEYTDSFYSLICLIPTVGSLIGLTTKYLIKYFSNKNPDYRKYYNSITSLKEITKELQIVENKNFNIDDIAYNDIENEYDA